MSDFRGTLGNVKAMPELDAEAVRREMAGDHKSPSNFVTEPVVWEADPFYEAAEQVQVDLDDLQGSMSSLRRASAEERRNSDFEFEKGEIVAGCDSIQQEVNDFLEVLRITGQKLDQFHISPEELERRYQFVNALKKQLADIRAEVKTLLRTPASSTGPGEAAAEIKGEDGQNESPTSEIRDEVVEVSKPVEKPTGVLLGDLGRMPAWDLARLQEEERSKAEGRILKIYTDIENGSDRQEAGSSGGGARSHFLHFRPEPFLRRAQDEIARSVLKFASTVVNMEPSQLASIAFFFIGVYGLHTFYSHDESLV
ncbi:hypothetical protein CYMTET_45476 [Cymbomonas tetramitiformis]|uniref:Syntaxin 6/10/61 N-terminal domain-containing protein n=1 Tax=Cymbomonas tetramitiformis TaxID=36881 RepID=A0AAE0BZX4_9CHLO|nr:hypothetical protein CYMTET_45476 [Cymbomonas tetramitiformis]